MGSVQTGTPSGPIHPGLRHVAFPGFGQAYCYGGGAKSFEPGSGIGPLNGFHGTSLPVTNLSSDLVTLVICCYLKGIIQPSHLGIIINPGCLGYIGDDISYPVI